MAMKKSMRARGKIPFSKYFQKLSDGDSVAVVKELAVTSNIPDRMQGRTGVVVSKQGKSYFVKIKDHCKEKTYLVHPAHLKKIQNIEKNGSN